MLIFTFFRFRRSFVGSPLNVLAIYSHVSINDIYHEIHTFGVYTSLSIIHVAHKLITWLIHCRFVNLFDSSTVSFRARATRYSSLLTNLPCSFIRITWRVSSGIFYLNSARVYVRRSLHPVCGQRSEILSIRGK